MADLIDREELLKEMEALYCHHLEMRNFSADGAVYDCIDLVQAAPIKPYPVNLDHSACCTTSDPSKKCRGCIMFGEVHDMGATIPHCGLVDDLWEGMKRCEEPGECYHKTGGGEIRRYILSKTQTRRAMIETEENKK